MLHNVLCYVMYKIVLNVLLSAKYAVKKKDNSLLQTHDLSTHHEAREQKNYAFECGTKVESLTTWGDGT